MFTRRCSERRFFLRPDPLVTNAFWYCLGWAAEKHGMILHAAVAMSNHVHVVASDPRGVYPDFLRDFNGLLARVVNAARGRWEHFWDSNQASVVLLEDEAAQLDKVVYTLTNPVGLVDSAADWPGATALPAVLSGTTVVAKRPEHFFRTQDDGGGMPATVELCFLPPPSLSALPRRDYSSLIKEHVDRVEAEAAVARRGARTAVLGKRRILAQRWNDKPSDAEPRRELSPSVACRDQWLRIERLQLNKRFQEIYRDARDAFRAGLEAIFPCGTWLMRFRAPVQVSSA
jgi:REP element-mobilizing transposase RayT